VSAGELERTRDAHYWAPPVGVGAIPWILKVWVDLPQSRSPTVQSPSPTFLPKSHSMPSPRTNQAMSDAGAAAIKSGSPGSEQSPGYREKNSHPGPLTVTASERTPCRRMLPRSITGPGRDRDRSVMVLPCGLLVRTAQPRARSSPDRRLGRSGSPAAIPARGAAPHWALAGAARNRRCQQAMAQGPTRRAAPACGHGSRRWRRSPP
jgi:hypothetical protein